MLQGVSGCFRVLQGVAGCCSVVDDIARTLPGTVPHVLMCVAVCCRCCSVLQCVKSVPILRPVLSLACRTELISSNYSHLPHGSYLISSLISTLV